MEIYFLNERYQIFSVIDDYTCFIRRRSYYDCDEFELYCHENDFFAAKRARYVVSSDSISNIYLVETVIYRNRSIQIKGRSADCLFERSVIYPTCQISGTGEEVLHSLVSRYTDIKSAPLNGVGSVVERGQVTGYGLLDYMHDLSIEQELSFNVLLNDKDSTLEFTVWQGNDRTSMQSENSPVVFSEDFENIISCEYNYSEKDYRNVAIVAGTGTGSDRKWVTVDLSGSEEKRMLYVDARDIQQEDDMTDERYLELLRRRGLEKLAQYSIIESFEAEVNPNSILLYKKDFDLGDKVTIRSERLGISLDCRITLIEEVYENSNMTLTLSFGEGFLSTISYIERMYR